MPSAATDAAFKVRLAAWTEGPVAGVGDMPDTQTEPPAGVSNFLVVQYPVVNGEKPVLHGKYWEDGAARLVLNVSRQSGQAYGLQLADTLAALFRDYNPGGGFRTFVPSPPAIDDSIDDGSWVQFSIIVPYRYQHT